MPRSPATLQRALSTTRFRVYASADVRGVQLCGAAKNVIGIAAGISDGMGFGDNARAALITRGLAEMTRLGCGARRRSAHLRGPRRPGRPGRDLHLAGTRATAPPASCSRAAVAPDAAEREVGMVAEGLHTAPALAALAREAGVDLPITDAVCSVIAGASIPDALATSCSRAQPPPGSSRRQAAAAQLDDRCHADHADERGEHVRIEAAAAALLEDRKRARLRRRRGDRRARS